MQRRALIALAGAAATAWPLMGHGQQIKPARVGVLHVGNPDAELFTSELRQGLRELGYVEGQTVRLEIRSAEEKLGRLPELAADLVRLGVDVIVAFYTPCALAAKAATSKIPIVVTAGDLIEAGFVESLARPGGNITGLSLMAAPLHVKAVDLLREIVPTVRRVAILANAADPVFAKMLVETAQRAGRGAGIEILPVMVRIDDMQSAFAAMAREGAEAVVVQGSFSGRRVADLAIEHRLPSASIARSFVESGGLLSYGPDGPTTYRRSAVFVHKILQGGNPATISVEQPTKFELAVNLKTAAALGVAVPEPFLSRADTVVE